MGEEDRIEDQDQEGYRSLWEVLQGSVLDNVRARSRADLETSVASSTSSGLVKLGSLAGVMK